MKTLLTDYTRYNLWANKHLSEVMLKLSDEQLDKEITSSFSSIRKTIYHIWGAEDIWKKRLSHEPFEKWAGSDNNFSLEEVIHQWNETSQWFIEFVETSSEDFLKTKLTYKNLAGTEYTNQVSDVIQHVLNHGTFHRGQLITMLRQVGITQLPATDYIAFFR